MAKSSWRARGVGEASAGRVALPSSDVGEQIVHEGCERRCHCWIVLSGAACELCDATLRGRSVCALDLDRLGSHCGRVLVIAVAREAAHQFRGVDGLEHAEGV